MDAHALLKSQGWRGTGHSLHPTNDSTGLTRPILVSRKQNNLGVGKKQHNTSDMWWMNAFDQSLKGLDTSKEGTVVQTVSNGGLDMIVKGGSRFVGNKGLYASFVRGESLSGTITPEETNQDSSDAAEKKKDKASKLSKEERRAAKAARRMAKAKEKEESALALSSADDQSPDTEIKLESKEDRKTRKRLKKLLRQKLTDEAALKDKSEQAEENMTIKEKSRSNEERRDRKRRKKSLAGEDADATEGREGTKKKRRKC